MKKPRIHDKRKLGNTDNWDKDTGRQNDKRKVLEDELGAETDGDAIMTTEILYLSSIAMNHNSCAHMAFPDLKKMYQEVLQTKDVFMITIDAEGVRAVKIVRTPTKRVETINIEDEFDYLDTLDHQEMMKDTER